MNGVISKHGDIASASLAVLRHNKSLIALQIIWFCCLVAGSFAIWVPVLIHANIRIDFIDYDSEWIVEPVVWVGWAATLTLYILVHAFFRTAIIHSSWEYFSGSSTSTYRSMIATIVRIRHLRPLVPYNGNARNTLYMPTQVVERTIATDTRKRAQQLFQNTWGSGPASITDGTLALRIALLALFVVGLIIRYMSGKSKRPVIYPDEVHLLLVETKTGTSWIKSGVPTTSSIGTYIFALVFTAVGISLVWIAMVTITSINKVVLYRFAATGNSPDEFRGIHLDRAFIMIDEVKAERKARRAERRKNRSGQLRNMLFGPPRTNSPDASHQTETN